MGICNSKYDFIDLSISHNILSKIEKNVCKVSVNNENIKTGFFCIIPDLFHSQLIPALIINIHLQKIETNKSINVSFLDINNNTIEKNIESRVIFIDKDFEISIIETSPLFSFSSLALCFNFFKRRFIFIRFQTYLPRFQTI